MATRLNPRDRTAPLHVMHLVSALHPGGMEFGVVKLVNGLDRRSVRSSICSTRPADAQMRALVEPGVPVFELRRRDGNDPALVWALVRLFRRERPHVVHTHAWGTLLEGLVAARLARVPLVVHGEHGTLQLRPYQRWIQRAAWARADRVLSVSSLLAARMARETGFPADRIRTIRNGVDLSRFGGRTQAAARRLLGLDPGALVVGTAGRLVAVKDHRTLLEAVADLRSRNVPATLVVAGDGPLRAELEAAAATLGIAAHVRLIGHHERIEDLLPAMDVFVLSSISEGLSNTILEAMASGLPVVATRVGGAEELVVDGETGVLVPSRSPGALADAVARLLASPQLRQAMGSAARRRTESEFALPSVVQRYERFYLELARPAAPTVEPRGVEVH